MTDRFSSQEEDLSFLNKEYAEGMWVRGQGKLLVEWMAEETAEQQGYEWVFLDQFQKSAFLHNTLRYLPIIMGFIKGVENPYKSCDEYCALMGKDTEYDAVEKFRAAILSELEVK